VSKHKRTIVPTKSIGEMATTAEKIRVSVVLLILCIALFPILKSFAGDKKVFTNDDLGEYTYGNGKTEDVIESTDKPSPKTPESFTARAKRPYSDITAILYKTST